MDIQAPTREKQREEKMQEGAGVVKEQMMQDACAR
jgi:hypothetical protein